MATPLFINYLDFSGTINLSIDHNSPEDFNDFAATSEKRLLICLLNAKLYNELIEDLDGDNNPQTQKFIDLVDGVTYTDTYTQETKILYGLKDLIRYFVYSVWREEQYSFNTQIGDVRENAQNADKVSRTQQKIALKKGWNEFVSKYKDTCYFIDNKFETYFPDNNDYSYWSPKVFETKGKIKTGQQTWINPSSNYKSCKTCK